MDLIGAGSVVPWAKNGVVCEVGVGRDLLKAVDAVVVLQGGDERLDEGEDNVWRHVGGNGDGDVCIMLQPHLEIPFPGGGVWCLA